MIEKLRAYAKRHGVPVHNKNGIEYYLPVRVVEELIKENEAESVGVIEYVNGKRKNGRDI